MERQRFAYIEKSSKDDFDWAERAAIGARQTDTWFRRMPVGWKLEDGFEWTRYAKQVRDRAWQTTWNGCAVDWVRAGACSCLQPSGHLRRRRCSFQTQPVREMVPLGAYSQRPLRVRLHQHTQPGRERRNRLLLCESAKADAAQAAARLGSRDSVCSRECSSILAGSPGRTACRVSRGCTRCTITGMDSGRYSSQQQALLISSITSVRLRLPVCHKQNLCHETRCFIKWSG